jgi:fumarate hydratase class II
MTEFRAEADRLGKVNVASDKLWGAQNSALAGAFQHRP